MGQDPMYYIELLTSTDLLNGNDNIVLEGWLTKKGIVKWNARWCALVKYGYLNYIDPEQKQGIRSIDICTAEFILEDANNLIQWKNEKGEWYQFRCDSKSIQTKWHLEMKNIQKHCLQLRKQNETNINNSPTLFAFTVRKPLPLTTTNEIKSNRLEEHFFCADNDHYLEGWKKCIIEQIAHCTDDHVIKRTRQQSQYLRKQLLSKLDLNNSDDSALETLHERSPKIFKRSKNSKKSLSKHSMSH